MTGNTAVMNEEVARRHGSSTAKRNFVHPRVPTSLMNQVDQTVATAQEFGMPKYASRNEFVEAAVRALLFKEKGRKTA